MNKKNKRLLSIVLTASVSLSIVAGTGITRVKAAGLDTKNVQAIARKNSISNKFSPADSENWREQKYGVSDFDDNKPRESTNSNEMVRVIVQLQDKPAAESGKKAATVKANQSNIKKKVKALSGAKIKQSYGYLVNGFSATVKRGDIEKIKAMSGVKKVTEAKVYYPDMQYAKELTQAYNTWEDLGLKGEGMVVAIIDTGIDVTHKDMVLDDEAKDDVKIKDVKSGFTLKVPYGHNFADGNDVVKDTTSSMHGMHVAGIVGANGDDEKVKTNEAIEGVAPEAQLLAMKVFSNDPNNSGAYSDDIIAAIEDSVLHGADVINMSLGSTAAFQDADDPEQKAVKNAVDKGTMVVVSAGNSYYSTYPYKFTDMADTGLVGAPGLAEDSLQVASYENDKIVANGLNYTGSDTPMAYFTSEVDPVGVLKGEYELVDCGLGDVADFEGKDLKGKIALIQRGSIDFITKKLNAQVAGAAGVIVYNNAAGGDAYVNMATDPKVTIPAVFISNTDGVKLQGLISEGVKISFKGTLTTVANSTSKDMSDFTSWGPTPNLDFKPEITAPGGNIWSTVNNDRYEVMSGTSMAAPHTSGAEALILQAIKKNNPTLSGRNLVELAKNTTINTALTEMDKNHSAVPYSPRRQGAGMVQIESAIKNNVTVTDDSGDAAVALKEIGKNTTFTLNLKNYGDKDVTYTLGSVGGLLTEYNPSVDEFVSFETPYEVKVGDLKFDKNTVTVPANGTAKVDVTINVSNSVSTEEFVEGFVKFTSNDESVPSLVSPFMGFYGDWSVQNIIDKPMWDYNAIWGTSTLLTEQEDGYYYLGQTGETDYGPLIDPDKIAISPNDDGYSDNVTPIFTFFRNAKEMKVEVLDKDKKLISQVALDNNISKNALGDDTDPGYKISDDWTWNGKVYNNKTGKYEVLSDGQYYINYVTKVDYANAKEQDYIVPVKIDSTNPEIKITSGTTADAANYTLKWTQSDNLSGIDGNSYIFVNGEQVNAEVTNTDGVYSCNLTLEENKVNSIQVVAFDYANNAAAAQLNVREGNVPFNITLDNIESGISVNQADLTVTGSVSFKPSVLKINGVDATVNDDLTFSADIKLVEGVNNVSILAQDVDGSNLSNYAVKVYCDTIAPVINLESPSVDKDEKAYVNKDTISLKGKVADNTLGYKFYVNGEQKFQVELDGEQGEEATTKEFNYEIPAENNTYVELKAVDWFGHETVKNINVIVDKEKPVITFNNIKDGETYNKNVKPEVSTTEGTLTMTLNGKEYNGEEITADGKYDLIVKAVDKASNTSEAKVTFYIDKTSPAAPTITLSTTAPTNKKVAVTIVSDEDAKLEYSFDNKTWKEYTDKFEVAANTTIYARATDSSSNVSEVSKLGVKNIDTEAPAVPTVNVSTKSPTNTDVTVTITGEEGAVLLYSFDKNIWNVYSKSITVDKNTTIYIKQADKAANVSEVGTVVINNIDKAAPVVTVKNVEDGKVYDKDVKVQVSVNEGTYTMKLDGKEYKGEEITSAGQHTLVVNGKDAAGNITVKTITFTIKTKESSTPDNNGGNTPTNGSNNGSTTTNNNSGSKTNTSPNNNTSTTTAASTNLPKTGSTVDMNVLLTIGALITVIGVIFVVGKKKRRKTE